MSFLPILLSGRRFDDATIISHGQEDAGFPVEHLKDPSPRRPWRFTTGTPSFDSHFIVDLGLLTTPYDTFATLFSNTLSVNLDVWRVQAGDDTSGTGQFDSGFMPLWPGPAFLRTDPRHPEFYQPEGAHAFLRLDGFLQRRYVRVDYSFHNVPAGAGGQIGRFMMGEALTPLVIYGSGTPTPVGSPPKLVNTWDALLTEEQNELIAYAMAFDRGSSPRVLTSWGGDVSLLDGAKTILMHNNVLAPKPWKLQQLAVYGYIEQMTPIEISAFEEYRTRITVRGM